MPELSRRRRPRLTSAWSLVVALSAFTTLPTIARADDARSAEAVSDVKRSEAKTHFEDGVKAYGEGRYGEAVEAFQRADALAPSAPLSFNIALAFEQLSNPSAALRWYRDYLRRSPQAANLGEVSAKVGALAAKVAERGVQQLSVLSTPEGARVVLDGQPAGVTPITLELAPGPHRVQLHLNGYSDRQQDIVLDPRVPQDVVLELAARTPEATQPAPSSRRDQAPPAAGPAKRPFGIAPYILLGAGAAGMLGALGFELGRRDAEGEAKRAPQREYLDHFEAMESRQTVARVLLGVGGALVVTGGVLLVLNTPRERAPAVALGCDAAGCGLAAKGSF